MPYTPGPGEYFDDERYFGDLVHWEQGLSTSSVQVPYAGVQGQVQQQPMSPGWDSNSSTLSPWPFPNQTMTIDPSQAWFGGHGQWPAQQASREPSPPVSDPPSSPAQATMTVSTAFNLDTRPTLGHPPDCELMSSDDVVFYVNITLLRHGSSTGFGLAFPTSGARVRVAETADVLNLILHAAYGASPSAFAPPLETLGEAIARLPAYGLSPQVYVGANTPLFETLRSHAALSPLRVYAIAAAHDLLALAKLASGNLLGYPVHAMADADAIAMGPVYLRRLVTLHHDRIAQLRGLLEQSQEFHPQVHTCAFQAQKRLAREWSMVANEVIAGARPDISSSVVRDKLAVVKNQTACASCKKRLDERIWKAVVGWTMLPTTI
ncbi:uncharacterized protein SCHCODRAFT_01131553 [Schizophyllum commune H4-8]|uniref:uncharacterized protein n=1 Tax=Schizophyllum commune (strain H4-8 / FGSC 9210) TaxID=578458 RepID=UPI00215FAFDE|nr:uncharacterized protein SCHCODRAFT_01131553 [Schizophyllum commune H4-8]KAI5889750.1 hypothetical protein SCHCODRAFT_01131553 [Schizophyllum commune H4-8]